MPVTCTRTVMRHDSVSSLIRLTISQKPDTNYTTSHCHDRQLCHRLRGHSVRNCPPLHSRPAEQEARSGRGPGRWRRCPWPSQLQGLPFLGLELDCFVTTSDCYGLLYIPRAGYGYGYGFGKYLHTAFLSDFGSSSWLASIMTSIHDARCMMHYDVLFYLSIIGY